MGVPPTEWMYPLAEKRLRQEEEKEEEEFDRESPKGKRYILKQ